MRQMAYSAKAWVAGMAAFLTAMLAEWTGGDDPFQPRDMFVGLLAFAITFSTVYATPNRRRDATIED